MKKLVWLALAVMVASCSVKTSPVTETPGTRTEAPAAPGKEAAEDSRTRELREVVKRADPIIDNILRSIDQNDYDQYIRDFNKNWLAANKDREKFERANQRRHERIGQSLGRQVWKVVKENPYYVVYYWVNFSKVDDPVTVRMVLSQEYTGLQVGFLTYLHPALRD